MASYHNSFTYLKKNSKEQGLIIVSFEPDSGFVDTFLGMDQVYEDYYDGSKKFLYGTKYNSTATIDVTIIKADGSDWTINDNRQALRWLTGSRTASWLDLYQGDTIKYSFLGSITSSEQYKLDGRTVGLKFTFTSITPWAFSAPQVFDCSIFQLMDITTDGVIYKEDRTTTFGLHNGLLSTSGVDAGGEFNITADGILYMDNSYHTTIDNQSDDLYTYIYLDIDYKNENGEYISIYNNTLDEESLINNVQPNESIQISAKQFIISDIPNKLFGDDFNFIWPRLQPGINDLIISGNGKGAAKFTYRYPMKVGDCAMDIDTYGSNGICCDNTDIPSYDTIRWQDITGTPTSLAGYGITDAYTVDEVYNKHEVYSDDEVYAKDETYSKSEIDEKIENIEISGGGGSVMISEKALNDMLADILR